MQINTKRLELSSDGTVIPSCKDTACIGAKCNDIAELFEGWESLVNDDAVPLPLTFYRSSKASKT